MYKREKTFNHEVLLQQIIDIWIVITQINGILKYRIRKAQEGKIFTMSLRS